MYITKLHRGADLYVQLVHRKSYMQRTHKNLDLKYNLRHATATLNTI